MRYNCKIAMVLVFTTTSISAGAAFADDKLKGTYAVAGITSCLVAPSGFSNDISRYSRLHHWNRYRQEHPAFDRPRRTLDMPLSTRRGHCRKIMMKNAINPRSAISAASTRARERGMYG